MTLAEKQKFFSEAVILQREAVKLTRWQYLDEPGAGAMIDAAAKLENAAFLLRSVSQALRQELSQQREFLRSQAA